MSRLDAASAVMSWVLAAAGIAFAVAAGHACNATATAANFLLLTATSCTIQLLASLATCVSYRYWVATSINQPRLGPSQHEPHVRRGLPALTASGKLSALDAWSWLVLSLAVLPILPPTLSFYRPSAQLRFASEMQDQLGIAAATAADSARNGGRRYTVGAYEAVQLSLQAKVPERGAAIEMINTANVAIDARANRVYVPSHVTAACRYPEVRARNITAMVATYSCSSVISSNQTCNTTTNKQEVCVSVSNAALEAQQPAADQYMRVVHDDKLLVLCGVTFSLAQLDVTWRGDNTGHGTMVDGWVRNCQIAKFTLLPGAERAVTGEEWDSMPQSQDLLGDELLQGLSLPLGNAFVHTVGHERVKLLSEEDRSDLYGSIFGAAAITRGTGFRFDPTKSSPTVPPVEVHYAKHVCQQYGSSGMIVFLVVADIVMAICCTFVASGATLQQLCDSLQELVAAVSCGRRAALSPGKPEASAAPAAAIVLGNGLQGAVMVGQFGDGSPPASSVATSGTLTTNPASMNRA